MPAAAWDAAARGPLRALGRDTAVLEMAYGGLTPLGAEVRGRTARYADGLGMLVHQAARAVELALGEAPPLPPCSAPPARLTASSGAPDVARDP